MCNRFAAIGMLLSVSFCSAQSMRTAHRAGPASIGCPTSGKVVVQLDLLSIPVSLQQLISRSDLIVRGTINRTFPSFHPDPDNSVTIETDSVVSIADTLRGVSGSTSIALEQMGGKTKACEEIVPEDPLVKAGESYILFLKKDDRPSIVNVSGLDRYDAVGVWHGKVKISDQKVHFLNAASVGLHKYDNTDEADFTINIRQITAALPPKNERREQSK